jgi:putative solute:sodium symporter small subunit
MKPESPDTGSQRLAAYWRSARRLTMILLGIWFLVTFSVIFFARSLSEFTLFGWTFSYYMAAQGTLFVYLAIVGFHAWAMARLDQRLTGKDGHDD